DITKQRGEHQGNEIPRNKFKVMTIAPANVTKINNNGNNSNNSSDRDDRDDSDRSMNIVKNRGMKPAKKRSKDDRGGSQHTHTTIEV
ncbi:hypothetical protein BGZ83_008316, partial [Gryganskiella cystojenkinii]